MDIRCFKLKHNGNTIRWQNSHMFCLSDAWELYTIVMKLTSFYFLKELGLHKLTNHIVCMTYAGETDIFLFQSRPFQSCYFPLQSNLS